MQPMRARCRSAKSSTRFSSAAVCLSLTALVVLSNCGVLWCQTLTNTAGPPRSCFVIAPAATKIGHSIFQGKDQFWYSVQAPYPADDVLKLITGRLKGMGWVALKEDWLNPGLPSSHIRGWNYYEDQTTYPTTSVRVWGADWENRAHDILSYQLEYRCPDNLCASTAGLDDLRVIAIYIPAKLAKQIKSSISRERTEHR